jgi:hypothetical protein
MTRRTVAYWVTTIFVVFNMLSGGLAELALLKPNVDGMQALGYPIYMMLILGTWKVLGSIAVLAPRCPRLKEWAYRLSHDQQWRKFEVHCAAQGFSARMLSSVGVR